LPDGKGDACDNCKYVFNPAQNNAVNPTTPAGDACEPLDSDGYESRRPREIEDLTQCPEAAFSRREIESAVHEALKEIAVEYRIAVILRDMEGLSYEEIADTLRVSLGTVKSRLWRGRMELKKAIQPFLSNQSGYNEVR